MGGGLILGEGTILQKGPIGDSALVWVIPLASWLRNLEFQGYSLKVLHPKLAF